ncbi:UDP-2,3-diacylglucosamine hydrolase [Anseongella ginsenosidimutans]|uniref:UDP-2,3-diacylglucosamine hydrolase n=1 Tax=Anseongella ginsenosidimutans TaxID=496056 RepID=A0A4R3KZ03_9SPHI|nr:UDP-2,3-diacylglucosamine diphosphatase [Anseongella ginsenosidimutans]QEC51443.1 UDP-2,3-diacylglucosamine diphosphatase [Anseongella ginsenosidimutans]TCS89850.1 UDP-2,3-diacylglucosamine hydrolase [Anseongella ginsenosidimutans]
MQHRKVELVVISDVHLGTFGAKANKLYEYLRSIRPETIVLNGDFIDFWQLSTYYWPESHQLVLETLRNYLEEGVNVYYLPGNHDDVLRRFTFSSLLRFKLVNELELELDGKKAWFIHGDAYDFTMKSKLVTKLGAFSYGATVLINKGLNVLWKPLTGREIRLSKALKNWVKKKVRSVEDFQQKAIDIALEKKMDYLVCGHNHLPEIKMVENGEQSLLYLNSGDWIENTSALEYNGGAWSLYYYKG